MKSSEHSVIETHYRELFYAYEDLCRFARIGYNTGAAQMLRKHHAKLPFLLHHSDCAGCVLDWKGGSRHEARDGNPFKVFGGASVDGVDS